MFPSLLPSTLFFFSLLSTCCHAEAGPAFSWRFNSNFVSTSLLECQKLSIAVTSLRGNATSFGRPPYYMMAFELGGTPTTTFVGENRSALEWVVRHTAGSTLMLGMVDSNGSAGGIAPNLYSVVSGTDKSCLPSPPSSDFVVEADTSTTLRTCQPWSMTISGGVKPYTVTLAALDSPIVTNVTMGAVDDFFTYVNRANPGTWLAAAISDATGEFARGTPFVETRGSHDSSCPGLVTSSGDAAKARVAQEKARQTRKRKITVAVSVTLTIVFLVACGVAAYIYIRRRIARLTAQDLTPRQFKEHLPTTLSTPGPLRLNTRLSVIVSSPLTAIKPSPIQTVGLSPSSPVPRHDSSCPPDCDCQRQRLLSPPSAHPSIRTKADMFVMRTIPEVNEVGQSPLSPVGQQQETASRVARDLPPILVEAGVQREIIIQHRDGGRAVVLEIPPPYPSDATHGSQDGE